MHTYTCTHTPHTSHMHTHTSICSVQSLSRVRLFVTPWTATRQGFLPFTRSRSLLKLMSTELVMPSNHLILSRPLLLQPSIFASIRGFSNESVLHKHTHAQIFTRHNMHAYTHTHMCSTYMTDTHIHAHISILHNTHAHTHAQHM